MATKPCPCGNAGEPTRVCTCSESDIVRYRSRLSGPLADRIDMHVMLGAVSAALLQESASAEPSRVIRARVERCRGRQRERYAHVSGVTTNSQAPGRWLLAHGGLQPAGRTVLVAAMEALSLSARGFHRVLRVSRTIADLEECESVTATHVAEALRYRPIR